MSLKVETPSEFSIILSNTTVPHNRKGAKILLPFLYFIHLRSSLGYSKTRIKPVCIQQQIFSYVLNIRISLRFLYSNLCFWCLDDLIFLVIHSKLYTYLPNSDLSQTDSCSNLVYLPPSEMKFQLFIFTQAQRE